jgi:hypothetical protein
MAKTISKLVLIQQERRRLEGEVSELREILTAKETRLQQLTIAEEVVASLPDVEPAGIDQRSSSTNAPTWSEKRSPKPEGTPTVPEMIVEALLDCQARGQKGMEPKDIARFISRRWWPAVTINAVGPVAWRMHKQGKLTKRGSKYSLPKNDEGSNAPTSEPSSSERGAGGGPRGAASHPSPAGSTPVSSTSSIRRDLFASTAVSSGRAPLSRKEADCVASSHLVMSR